MSKREPTLAVFDVDNTFLKSDSLLLTMRISSTKIDFILNSLRCLPCFILWFLKIKNDESFKESIIRNFKLCEYVNDLLKNQKLNLLVDYLKKNIRK